MLEEEKRNWSLTLLKAFNNKGSMVDILLFSIFFALLSITFIFGAAILGGINNNVQSLPSAVAGSNVTQSVFNTANNRVVTWLDSIFIFVVFMFWISIMISVFMLDTNPVFFMINVIIGIFVVFVGVVINNVMHYFNNGALSDTASRFTIMSTFFNNYPLVIAVIIFTVLIALFIKGGGR